MELNQLKIFCVAAQTLNFTKAAHQMGYAQSNITGQIKQLEDSLQVKLFERLGRKIHLTGDGVKFLEYARSILQLCDRAQEEFSPNVFRGILNIGAAETICVHRLPKILTEYRKLYPLVEIQVHSGICETFFDEIRTNRIDFALMLTDTIQAPDMAVRTLWDENLILVAAPLHPLAKKDRITPDDIGQECLITTLPGCGYRPLIRTMLQDQGVKLTSVMELASVGAIKECTACGLGVSFLPTVSVKPELAAKKLIALNWTGPKIDVKTQLVYHQEKWLTPAMGAFLDLASSI